jgi:hypothetical protein
VNEQRSISISQSYATGSATAKMATPTTRARWWGEHGSISQSYATGSATAKDGNANYAGALVGVNDLAGSIRQSYATGSATTGEAITPRARGGTATAASAKATGTKNLPPMRWAAAAPLVRRG